MLEYRGYSENPRDLDQSPAVPLTDYIHLGYKLEFFNLVTSHKAKLPASKIAVRIQYNIACKGQGTKPGT